MTNSRVSYYIKALAIVLERREPIIVEIDDAKIDASWLLLHISRTINESERNKSELDYAEEYF